MDELDRFDLEELKKWFDEEKEDMPKPIRIMWEKLILPGWERIINLKEEEELENIQSPPPSTLPVFEESWEYNVKIKLDKKWIELRKNKDLGAWILPVRIEEGNFKVLTGHIIITKEGNVVFVKKEEFYRAIRRQRS